MHAGRKDAALASCSSTRAGIPSADPDQLQATPTHLQTMTFAVNYVGEPFNTPLEENRLFAASVRWSAALYVALVIDIPRGEPYSM